MGTNRSRTANRPSKWLPPTGAAAFFSAASDQEFKQQHPIGYFFLSLLGIAALCTPLVLYASYTIYADYNSGWMLLGLAGAFIFGIGLFNFVAILIKQYLGHLVSLLSFLIGGLMVAVSLLMMQ